MTINIRFQGYGVALKKIGEYSFALLDIWGSADNNVFAVGMLGKILHYDGINWAELSIIKFTYLTQVAAYRTYDILRDSIKRTVLSSKPCCATAWILFGSIRLTRLPAVSAVFRVRA